MFLHVLTMAVVTLTFSIHHLPLSLCFIFVESSCWEEFLQPRAGMKYIWYISYAREPIVILKSSQACMALLLCLRVESISFIVIISGRYF